MADALCFELTRLSDRQRCQIQFWSEKAEPWPNDYQGRTFLARAVHKLGKARFPEWTSLEPITFPATEFDPRAITRDALERKRAQKAAVDLGLSVDGSPDDLARALNDLITIHAPSRKAAVDRMNAVRAAIITAAANGDLATFTRLKSGGDYYRQRAEEWNSESIHFRFWVCQQELGKPYQAPLYGIGNQWIFVSSDDLARMIEPPSAPAPPPQQDTTPVVAKPPLRRWSKKELEAIHAEWFSSWLSQANVRRPSREDARGWAKEHGLPVRRTEKIHADALKSAGIDTRGGRHSTKTRAS